MFDRGPENLNTNIYFEKVCVCAFMFLRSRFRTSSNELVGDLVTFYYDGFLTISNGADF